MVAPLAGEPEAVLGDRRPQEVAAELLESGAVVRQTRDKGSQGPSSFHGSWYSYLTDGGALSDASIKGQSPHRGDPGPP